MSVSRGRRSVAVTTRSKRGQEFFRDLLEALDAMPRKELIFGELQSVDGGVCALGSLGLKRGIDIKAIDPAEARDVAAALKIAPCLAEEVIRVNDALFDEDDESRWIRMWGWVSKQIAAPESDRRQA